MPLRCVAVLLLSIQSCAASPPAGEKADPYDDGFPVLRDTIAVHNGISPAAADSSLRISVVRIFSLPAGAEVFIDSVSQGKTPIDSLVVAPGRHTLKVVLKDFQEKRVPLIALPDSVETLSFTLIPTFGFVSVSVIPLDARVVIDSGDGTVGSVARRRLGVGWHSIAVSHSSNEQIAEGSFYLFPANSKTFEANLEGFSFSAAIRSAVIPGFGQILDGHVFKGSIELFTSLASGFLVYDSQRALRSRIADFRVSQAAYDTASTEDLAVSGRAAVLRASSRLTNARTYARTAISAFVAAYLVTLADALIFNSARHDLSLTGDVQLPPSQLAPPQSVGDAGLQLRLQYVVF